MGIRVQPKVIEIPPDDPFKYDLLNREGQIEILTRLVGSIEGPCTLAIDAPWGTGKTTFIKLWHQQLYNNGFPVVSFNAWENDFTNDPFHTLSSQLTKELHQYKNKSLDQKIVAVVKAAKGILNRTGNSGDPLV